ncbi:unnamed protein product [Malus baccata var. baccata]
MGIFPIFDRIKTPYLIGIGIGIMKSEFEPSQTTQLLGSQVKAYVHRFSIGKLGMFKKKRKPDDINNQGRWQTPPFDIMGNVVQRLNISDRIRLCIVCKSWSSISMQRDIRSGPQFPWLVLIQQSSEYLDLSIPSEGKVIKLALPKRNRGWFHSSSKGAKHKLPSLIAIPSFVGFVKEDKTPRHGEADYFVQKIALSSSDISECTVAAMFSSMELALCRPGEKRWTILNYKIDQPLDILFSSSGKLYALVKNHKIENENGSVIARTIRLRDGYQVELKLVYDKEEEWQRDPRYQRFSIGTRVIFDRVNNPQQSCVDPSDEGFYHICENGGSFLSVRSLGNEILFLAKQGFSLSFPENSFKGLEGNCIYFEANGVLQFNSSVRFATYYEALRLPTESNESDVFYLDDGKIEGSFSTDDETSRSTECGLSWFSPEI